MSSEDHRSWPSISTAPRQPKPQVVDVADGELGLIDRNRVVKLPNRSADDQQRFYRQLLYIASERGYQRGWAAHKYREKFGGWPSWRDLEPTFPDPAVRSWVRSRQIAFAKARRRRQPVRHEHDRTRSLSLA